MRCEMEWARPEACGTSATNFGKGNMVGKLLDRKFKFSS